jgi:hypothetical protein
MFNSIKAISLGVISLLLLGLVNQLVLIMASVGFSYLVKTYPSLLPWSQTFTYSMGALGHFIVMGLTGVVVAMTSAPKQAYLNAGLAVITGSCISLYLSLRDDIFTLIAFLFLVSGIIFALLGCWLWKRREERSN